MSNKKTVTFFRPKVIIEKNDIPVIFIDTFMWLKILNKLSREKEILEKCCREKKLLVIITNLLKGELKQRKILKEIKKICKESYMIIPSGRISANQIIHSMIAYYEDVKEIKLSWEISISEVPILKHPEMKLKNIVEEMIDELNKVRFEFSKEEFISSLVHVERENWMKELRLYWELISQKQKHGKSYEEFFTVTIS